MSQAQGNELRQKTALSSGPSPARCRWRRVGILASRRKTRQNGFRTIRSGAHTMTSILVRMFEHNRWANLRAVEACAGLTDA